MTNFEKLVELIKKVPGAYMAGEMTDAGYVEHRFRMGAGPHNVYSISKSVTGCAFGILEAEGRLRDSDTVYGHLEEYFPEDFDPKWKEVTLRDVMLHRTGVPDAANIDVDTMDFWADGQEDFLLHVLKQPIVHEPGKGPFVYCDTNYYLISRIVEKEAGMTAAEFLQLRMFNPLEWRGNAWGTCPQNHTLGGTGLFARTRDLAAYGYMLACGGEYHGKRILTEDYIARARGELNGYGYGFSNSDDGRWFATYGMYGQGIYILPECRTAFVALGHEMPTEEIRREIIPLYLK
ncbi:MAG: serine hydrolase [Clostridia bacterium]|nr:serine hydrolase [Clostridia bacterium]